jgi:hypothetical protein
MIFRVEFGVHVPEPSISSMVTGLNMYGLLSRDRSPRSYLVDVQRPAKAAALEKQLQAWESYGFLAWQAHKSDES